ncbi:MAG TPA: DUF2057 family protein [Gammaproteobacteria bacterium]|nr:DUF2057 family protein [Gammaproteobacteria bacterium]
MTRVLLIICCCTAAAFGAACTSAPVRLHDADAAAVAVISLPEQLEVASINGLEVEGVSGLLKKGDTTLEVAPGRYEVLVFYRELWQRGDHHDVLRSDPALFVVEAGAGGHYRLDYARPRDFGAAQALAADFTGWVEDLATGDRMPSRSSGLQFRQGVIPAVTFDDTLVPTAAGGGNGQVVAPLSSPVTRAGDGHAPPTASPEDEWLSLMQGWWNQASAAERRAFLHWLGEQR